MNIHEIILNMLICKQIISLDIHKNFQKKEVELLKVNTFTVRILLKPKVFTISVHFISTCNRR